MIAYGLLARLLGVVAHAAPASTTQVDFEGVDVRAAAMSPELQLVQEALRRSCPEGLTAGDPAWEECVVNLSYSRIKAICGRLDATTPLFVDTLFETDPPVPTLGKAANEDSVHWTACMWGAATGAHIGGFRWVRAGGEWILTDVPGGLGAAALFGVPAEATATPGRDDHAFLAFRLTPRTAGEWLAVPSEVNQDHLNGALRAAGLPAPFCGTIHPGDPPQGCRTLPAMYLRAVSPSLVILRSVGRVQERVYGILWQSVTGHDILEDLDVTPAAASP